jgi:hypothetical protein
VTKQDFLDLLQEVMTGLRPDEAKGKTGGGFSDLCQECGWEHHRCTCVGKAKAGAASKGFEPEEAE